MPQWLEAWYPAQAVPVDGPTILGEIAAAERANEPAQPKVIAAALAETLMLFGKPDHWDTTAKFYLEALSDVPADLLGDALKYVRMNSKFFPKPAEIRKPIAEELAKRTNALNRLRLADRQRRRAKPEESYRPPTEEEKARVAQLVASIAGRLNPKGNDGA